MVQEHQLNICAFFQVNVRHISDEFDPDILLDQFRTFLGSKDTSSNGSVFLFNMGIHYSLAINFTSYQVQTIDYTKGAREIASPCPFGHHLGFCRRESMGLSLRLNFMRPQTTNSEVYFIVHQSQTQDHAPVPAKSKMTAKGTRIGLYERFELKTRCFTCSLDCRGP